VTLGPDDHRIGEELAAHMAGYGDYFQTAAANLGPLSVAATQIETAKAGIERNQANAILLRHVADLLPRASGRYRRNDNTHSVDLGVFEIEGDEPQFAARRVQATTVWAKTSEGTSFLENTVIPCYLFGRRTDTPDSNLTRLLLVPASGMKDKWIGIHDFSPRILTVRKDDLKARDKLAGILLDKPFDDPEKLLHSQSGALIVNSGTEGSVRLVKRGRGDATPKRIANMGLRYDPGMTTILNKGVSDEILVQFEVDRAVAFLATAFSQTESLRALLEKGVPVPITREQRLEAQVEKYRRTIAAMFAAAGMSEAAIEEHLDKEFPRI
jgi:hypothetical protein